MKCPKCGYMHPKKPPNRPRKFTAEEERQIIEDEKKMEAYTRLEAYRKVAEKWGCHYQTISNIVKRNEK
jgi:transposase